MENTQFSRYEEDQSALVAQFGQYRAKLVKHAATALEVDAERPLEQKPEVIPVLAEVVSAALDEMKAAEVELTEANDRLLAARADMERQLRHYRLAFSSAPVALMITDLHGGILEVNQAAATLLRGDPYYLERKPIANMVPQPMRSQFRGQMRRLSLTEGVSGWRFTIERTRDAPIEVIAAVHVVPEGPGGSSLHWAIRAASEAVPK